MSERRKKKAIKNSVHTDEIIDIGNFMYVAVDFLGQNEITLVSSFYTDGGNLSGANFTTTF